MKTILISILLTLTVTVNAQKCENCKEVLLQTTAGDIRLKLYNETPLHRDNFLKLVNLHVYDSLLFHRVIKDFMIQCGDPKSKNAVGIVSRRRVVVVSTPGGQGPGRG